MVKNNKEKIIKLKLEEKNINKYQKLIDNMEKDFSEIVKQENIEKELRKAEMETKKIENLLSHKEEIFNRPKK